MGHFPHTNPLGRSDETNVCSFPNCTFVSGIEERMRPFFAVCEAADTVMHHFADSHWQADSFEKMLAAMEPLRVALLAAGYGLQKIEVPVCSRKRKSKS